MFPAAFPSFVPASEIHLKTDAEHLFYLEARRTGRIGRFAEEDVIVVYHIDIEVGGEPSGQGVIELYVPIDVDVLRIVQVVGVEFQARVERQFFPERRFRLRPDVRAELVEDAAAAFYSERTRVGEPVVAHERGPVGRRGDDDGQPCRRGVGQAEADGEVAGGHEVGDVFRGGDLVVVSFGELGVESSRRTGVQFPGYQPAVRAHNSNVHSREGKK